MSTLRTDLALIAACIPAGSRVLDLGCGQGALLSHLITTTNCTGTGVEIDPASVLAAIRRGVPVIELDIDRELARFADQSYDVVVLSRTLQAVHRPAEVLAQLSRIAPHTIVTMPNFAYWRNRIRLARGRAPVSKDLPFAWYDSPNVHFGSLLDLEDLFAELALPMERRIPLDETGAPSRWPHGTRNWSAGAALYVLGNG